MSIVSYHLDTSWLTSDDMWLWRWNILVSYKIIRPPSGPQSQTSKTRNNLAKYITVKIISFNIICIDLNDTEIHNSIRKIPVLNTESSINEMFFPLVELFNENIYCKHKELLESRLYCVYILDDVICT